MSSVAERRARRRWCRPRGRRAARRSRVAQPSAQARRDRHAAVQRAGHDGGGEDRLLRPDGHPEDPKPLTHDGRGHLARHSGGVLSPDLLKSHTRMCLFPNPVPGASTPLLPAGRVWRGDTTPAPNAPRYATCSTSSARTPRRSARAGPPSTSPPTWSCANAGRTRRAASCSSRWPDTPPGAGVLKAKHRYAGLVELLRSGPRRDLRPARPGRPQHRWSTSSTTRTYAARSGTGSHVSSPPTWSETLWKQVAGRRPLFLRRSPVGVVLHRIGRRRRPRRAQGRAQGRGDRHGGRALAVLLRPPGAREGRAHRRCRRHRPAQERQTGHVNGAPSFRVR